MEPPSAPPWYCFLYRLFGAHGTFWLWIVAVVALWWTGSGALLRLRNLEKRARSPADVARGAGGVRWVILDGLELDLDRRLFARRVPDGTVPAARLLLDRRGRVAQEWERTRRVADRGHALARLSGALGDLGGVAATGEAVLARQKLAERRASVLGEPKPYLPAPGDAVLLVGEEPFAAVQDGERETNPSDDSVGDRFGRFAAEVTRWGDLVRARVRPFAERDGLLDETSPAVIERLERETSVRVAPTSLRLGRRPRDAELYVFAAALVLVIFLAAGFHGVTRWERARAGAAG